MSKRSITYTKPEEPNFLKKLKQQVGYKEGPTVDTKREDLGPAEDLSDCDDEQPTVVVLGEGDLTAEQASRERDRLERDGKEHLLNSVIANSGFNECLTMTK
ncbi:DUF4604 domain containing protein [Asbolus verrucosus]|uniref:DUF4604 domain containing protein n=1 Tax=Asbolus verrucosus TaxID=1661398 RepID=A0A482VR58_ASBVE|nr:DUF4604 domain containing protein [Asbolus verrucosus]